MYLFSVSISTSPLTIKSLSIVKLSRLSIIVLSLSKAVGKFSFSSAAAATKPSSFSGFSIGAVIVSSSPTNCAASSASTSPRPNALAV